MSVDASHPGEDLDRLLDGRLEPDRALAVQAHVADCPRCRRELDAIRQARTVVRERLREQPVPPSLRAGVMDALDRADREGARHAAPRRRRLQRLSMGLGLAAAAVLLFLLGRVLGRDDFVRAAARDLADVRTAALPLEFVTADVAELERAFARAQLPFAARVFDFGMMGYALAGGRVHRIEGRTSALFAYRTDDGRTVVCQMYEGVITELPPPAEQHERNGIRFHVYREGSLTLVFWQEGRTLCVLSSDGPADEAIELAYAKAVRVD